MKRVAAIAGALVIAALSATSSADPTLALLAPAPGDDARKCIALGPHGEVYAPDGAGAWVRTQRITTADQLAVAGRAGGDVVAAGDGVVYKLAANGWTAIRLHQKDKATMAGGTRAVAAVKRQLYALDRTRAGEPEKLALAPAAVIAIGAGKSIVIAMDRGLARVEGTKVNMIASAPKQVVRLVDDRWAIVATGAHDLRTGKTTPWPAGAKVTATTTLDDSLVAVAIIGGVAGAAGSKLELLMLAKGKLDRQAIDLVPGPATPIGVAIDRAGRVVVALADGKLLVRDQKTWVAKAVSTALPSDRPGPPPARSP